MSSRVASPCAPSAVASSLPWPAPGGAATTLRYACPCGPSSWARTWPALEWAPLVYALRMPGQWQAAALAEEDRYFTISPNSR